MAIAKGVYQDVYGVREDEAEWRRLSALTEELDPATRRRIRALEPVPGGRFLEIGAGTGTVARWLARNYPTSTVMATDIDLRFLRRLPEGNLEVVKHDVTVDTFPEGSFDLIHARYVFEHLRERDEVLHRVMSWLAPGGALMIEDAATFPFQSSPHEVYRRVCQTAADIYRMRMGTDGRWARTFPAPLLSLGLRDTAAECMCSPVGHSTPWSRFWGPTLSTIATDLVSAGDVTADQVQRVIGLMDDPDFSDFGLATVAAWGRKTR